MPESKVSYTVCMNWNVSLMEWTGFNIFTMYQLQGFDIYMQVLS